jgi:hypothetical protein
MSQKNILKPDDIVIKKKDVVCRFLDNRAILLNPGYHHPFRLNEMGTRIWQLMDHPSRVDDLIDSVCGSHEIDRTEVVSDTISFLSELIEKKIIKRY